MHKNILLTLITVLLLPFSMRAEWIPINKQSTSPAPPMVTLISHDNTSTVLKIEISGFELTNLEAEGRHYQKVDLLSESFSADPGFPELPYIAKTLAIPDQAGISVDILETDDLQSFNNISLPPARESWFEGSPETLYTENTDAYQSMSSYPAEFVNLDPPSVFRDFRITRVSVFPLRYIPAKKELQVISSITVRINYGTGAAINPKTTVKKPIAPSFGSLYRSLIFNYQNVLNTSYGGKEEGHDLMLCIMPDEFFTSFQPYAEWKRQSGIDIHITKFSDIGANATNANIIKDHITDAYHNWEVPPTYVLLVGDDGVFPKQICSYGFPNEDFFVEIDGNDYFPELMIGRLTNQSDYGMQVMINKFLMYEKTPYTAATNWFKKGICCSNDAYESQIETKRFAAQRMLQDGGFILVDTMMSDPGCTYSVNDVINAIEDGRSFLNYRGEGWSSGWWASCTPLTLSELPGLDNGQKFTFVTSIGCGVAMFQTGGNCFGEEWLEMGTLSNPKGAAAFIGPTGNTHTTYNNKIDKGIYIGMFQEGLETPGQALVRGKLYMYTVFGNEYYVDYHYKIFCVLGDPSIRVWKDVPQAVMMDYPASIPFGNNTVEFTITHTSTGQPVANAQVCVTGNSIFSVGITDETGKAYVEISSIVEETLSVTVRGGNVYPSQGILYVVQPTGAYIVKDWYFINDDLGGNADGLMDYGETNLLSISMENVGVQQAENVSVTLHTTDNYITITDSTAFYGTIAAGSTAVVPNGFAYTVANNIPDLHTVTIEVEATNGSESWVSFISIGAHAPLLNYLNFVLNDPNGNNNGKFDPGETVSLMVDVENTGSSEAFNVMGELIENDPYVTIITSSMNYGNIAGGSHSIAEFIVSSGFNTPAGHFANFTLNLNAELGITGTGEFKVVVGQIPVLIVDLDGNENSSPEMETSFDALGVSYEKVSSFPAELNLYTTIFLCLGVYFDNHQLTSSEGLALANYLNNGGSLYMEGGDTWVLDQETAVHPMFNINGTNDGSGNLGIIQGSIGTFAQGMNFQYNGDDSFIDHIEPIAPAFTIFNNQSPFYGTCVAHDGGNYKTIGSSHEFGGLSDGVSPSTKVELMEQYLDFMGISQTLQAFLVANTTETCTEQILYFFDQSTGGPTSWLWTFEGGSPATSTNQNPLVAYFYPGTYGVTLTISDGTESNTLVVNDYITVVSLAAPPPVPTGPVNVCATEENSGYITGGLTGVTSYSWLLEPTDAGIVNGNGLNATVDWEMEFQGEATLKVAGENICGTGAYSNPVNITRYLPEVTLSPFDWVCLGWPAFELFGGMPSGGVYSGTGVANGWFDPAIAGAGTHNIIYTYIDSENCENFASETILVDPCTGLSERNDLSGIKIYPNPTSGLITIDFDQNFGTIEVLVMNMLNKVEYSETLEEMKTGNELNIDLSTLSKGVYFVKLKAENRIEIVKIILQ